MEFKINTLPHERGKCEIQWKLNLELNFDAEWNIE
jgi:hypothetical protein